MSHAHVIGTPGMQMPGDSERGPGRDTLSVAPPPVEVLRNSGLAAAVGSLASAIAIAYLARATTGGFWLDWVMALVMGGLGTAYLLAFLDARTPLLVADAYGVRIRLGTSWRGLPWEDIERVEHQPRRGLLRDGRLVLVAHDPERILAELDASGRRQSTLAQRLYGAPLAVPLALSTRVTGAGDDLTAALVRLAGDDSLVVEVDPQGSDEDFGDVEATQASDGAVEPTTRDVDVVLLPTVTQAYVAEVADVDVDDVDVVDHVVQADGADQPAAIPTGLPAGLRRLSWSDARSATARLAAGITAHLAYRRSDETESAEDPGADLVDETDDLDDGLEHTAPIAVVPLVPSATPSPLRAPARGVRAEITLDPVPAESSPVDGSADPAGPVLPEHDLLHRPTEEPLVDGDLAAWEPPAASPSVSEVLIGERIADARSALCLSVDELAEHTRIRPHVIEAIERDDFTPCGGDFYARGHLRTIARVLCLDVAPLLAVYDEHHADAPIDPRRVFEAELANLGNLAQGPIRGTRGRTNWSVLVAAVMAVVLVWSVARLLMDSPVQVTMPTPLLNGSAGPAGAAAAGKPVPVVLTAPRGGAHVVVRDGNGDVAYLGDLAFGETRTIERVKPPVRVQSSDGSVEVTINGKELGALGATGQPAQNLFPAGTDN